MAYNACMSTLYLVSTPIGNLGDLSPRAEDVLRGADRVLAEDTRRTRILTERAKSRARLVSLHEHNEAERTSQILGWLEAGETLALVSDAGTPLVSDPGRRVVDAVWRAGHDVVPVPGPSAILAALVASGLPADRFVFLGFPERKRAHRRRLLERVASSDETVVLFESPQRLVRLLEELTDVCGGARRVAVGRELTKVHEELVRGTLEEAAAYYRERPPKGEVTLVVAPRESGAEDDGSGERDARRLARELTAQGLSPSRVAKELARRLDLPRNTSYRIAHESPAQE